MFKFYKSTILETLFNQPIQDNYSCKSSNIGTRPTIQLRNPDRLLHFVFCCLKVNIYVLLKTVEGLGLVFGILNFIINLDLCGEIVYWECLVAEIVYFKTTNGLMNVWFQTNKYLQLHSKSSLCFRPIQARQALTPNAEDSRPAVQRPLSCQLVSCLLWSELRR